MAENAKVFKTFDGVLHDIEDTQARTDIARVEGNVYTKAEVDSRLTGYAETSYVDSELALKANVVDVYSKTETYSKSEADALLADKAGVGDSYTKAEDDALLADKANAADVYTITQTDGLLANKADVSSLDDYTTKATFAQFQSDVQAEFQTKADKSIVDDVVERLDACEFGTPIAVTTSNTKATSDGYYVLVVSGGSGGYSCSIGLNDVTVSYDFKTDGTPITIHAFVKKGMMMRYSKSSGSVLESSNFYPLVERS